MSPKSLHWLHKVPVFRNFLITSSVSLLGTSIFDFAMPLYIWDKTHSPIALAVISVSLGLPYFLMAPLTGYAVDHFNNRKLMLISDFGQVVVLFFLLFYDRSGSHAIWPIALGVFLVKTLSIIFETVATFHLIPSLVPKDKLNDANTLFLSSLRLIQIVGPLAGGIFMGTVGFQLCTILNILSYGATLIFVYRMRNLAEMIGYAGNGESLHKRLSAKAVAKSFSWSVNYIWSSPLFRPFIFAMFFWNLSSLVPNTTSLTYYFRGLKAFTSVEYGFLASLFGLMGIVGFIFAGPIYKRHDFRKSFNGACFWQATICTICLAFFAHPVLLAFVFGFSRIGSSVVAMGSFFIRQTEVPRHRLGAVNSTIRMHFMAAVPISALAQGFLIKHFGVSVSFILGALCLWGTYYYGKKVGIAYDQIGEDQVPYQAA